MTPGCECESCAAWRRVEAALPEGWGLDTGKPSFGDYWADAFGPAGRTPAIGPTPTAALTALAEALEAR